MLAMYGFHTDNSFWKKKYILEKEIILNDFVSFIKTVLKFVFSKKATNFDEIFTVDLTLTKAISYKKGIKNGAAR